MSNSKLVSVALVCVIVMLVAFGARSALLFALAGGVALAGALRPVNEAKTILFVVAFLALGLCVAECAALFIEPVFLGTPDRGLEPKPVIGWGYRQPGPVHVTRVVARQVQYDATYTINERLRRRTDAGTTGKSVTFLGGEFVFGSGVGDKDTLPQLFADDTGRRFPVVDLAVPAWSSANVLADIQSGAVDDILDKTGLAVEMLAPSHAERVVCGSVWEGTGRRFRLEDGKLVDAAPCPAPGSVLDAFAIYRVFIEPHLRYGSDAAIAILVAETTETIKLLRYKYNVPMIVYYQREPKYLRPFTWTDDRIVAALQAAGAEVLEFGIENGGDPKYAIESDGHPTALANKLRADRLAGYVDQHDPEFEGRRRHVTQTRRDRQSSAKASL